MCDSGGPEVVTTEDAYDLIGAVFLGSEVVSVPAERLDERFFSRGRRSPAPPEHGNNSHES